MAAEEKIEVPTMLIELINVGDTGYIMDGTEGTMHEQRIVAPPVSFIPNIGTMSEEILDEQTNKPTGRHANVKIRYIKNCPYIKISDQKKYGYEPGIGTENAIAIKKGKEVIKREGDVALFDFLQKVFYNLSAPNRSKNAKAIFKVVEVEQKTTELNDDAFLSAEAVNHVKTLFLKTGNSYKYKEDKIDNLLTALSTFGGDSYSEKITVLRKYAEQFPKKFLDVFSTMDNIPITELTHAVELNVIRFEGVTAEYCESKEILAVVGNENKSQSKKIEALAELLRTPEYAQAYQNFRVKLEIAQEASLKS